MYDIVCIYMYSFIRHCIITWKMQCWWRWDEICSFLYIQLKKTCLYFVFSSLFYKKAVRPSINVCAFFIKNIRWSILISKNWPNFNTNWFSRTLTCEEKTWSCRNWVYQQLYWNLSKLVSNWLWCVTRFAI